MKKLLLLLTLIIATSTSHIKTSQTGEYALAPAGLIAQFRANDFLEQCKFINSLDAFLRKDAANIILNTIGDPLKDCKQLTTMIQHADVELLRDQLVISLKMTELELALNFAGSEEFYAANAAALQTMRTHQEETLLLKNNLLRARQDLNFSDK